MRYIKELTVYDHMTILRNSEDSKLMQLAATQVYEDVVANLLVGRNSLMRRSMQQNADGSYTETRFAPNLKNKVETLTFPLFQDMMVRTLYKPPVSVRIYCFTK